MTGVTDSTRSPALIRMLNFSLQGGRCLRFRLTSLPFIKNEVPTWFRTFLDDISNLVPSFFFNFSLI